MFTGLIEETGMVKSLMPGRNSVAIQISASKMLKDLHVGYSISVNGVCLTVIRFSGDAFTVDVMAETMRHTNLGDLLVGAAVNLERALKLGDRLGGHFVSGHVDGTGLIKDFRREDIATIIIIEAEKSILKYIILKGSVAIDGISLTVAGITENSFTVGIIPHTSSETTLLKKHQGEKVNIECDMIGKYVENFIVKVKGEKTESKIDEAFLKENGFL